MELQELKNQLQNAIDQVAEAKDQVEEVMEQALMHTAHFQAYGKYGFDELLGNGNPYDSSLYSIMDKLERIEEERESKFKQAGESSGFDMRGIK